MDWGMVGGITIGICLILFTYWFVKLVFRKYYEYEHQSGMKAFFIRAITFPFIMLIFAILIWCAIDTLKSLMNRTD
jgi:hypothetical protein